MSFLRCFVEIILDKIIADKRFKFDGGVSEERKLELRTVLVTE
ncbi:hypothetical protein [Desulfosporosinus sp. OT]|nr:hypothetical protein [Desulfosporosinus sp. OT]EGW36713.1 hypothetical protein DOT_5394 [Desulfosporosinus sp. OT]